MILALFVSVAAGFCIGSGSLLEQGEKNEDQISCPEPKDLYIHYRVHQGDEYQDKFPVDTPITYRCGVGYLPRDIKTWNATCRMSTDGSLHWDIDKYDCRPVSCGHPGDVRWGRLMDAVFVFPRQVRYQCNKGYRLIGDAQLYCQSDGTWSSVKPECQIVDCGPLDGIPNGTVRLHSTQYGSKAEFTCNDGFKLRGTSIRTCDADGQWTDEFPHCEEIWCPQPDPPEGNGTTSLGANPGSQRSGARLEYFCPQKTVLVGSQINICQETGSWLFDPPVCTPNCVVQADHSAAVMRQTSSWSIKKVELQPGSEVAEFEQRLFVQCKEGYEFIDRIGDPQQRALRCQSGAWHPPGPWCTEQPCRNFHVEGGEPEYMNVLHNEVVNFTCKPNHKLQKKPNGRTPVCRFGKIWGDVPTCKPDDCRFEDLQNLVNGGKPRQHQRTSHDSVAVYDCESPLELEGPGRLRCSYGSWSGLPPKCVPPRKCTVPDYIGSKVLEPHWLSGYLNPTELTPGTVVNEGRSGPVVQCEDGYHFRDKQLRRIKQATLGCINGTWYPKAPWCEKIHLDVPPRNCTLPERADRFKAHHKHIRVLPLDIVPHGTELVFHCEPVGGTILKGAPTSQCDDGKWIPEVPFCYGIESRTEWDDLYLHFRTAKYTVPSGEVYVEPNTEVLVECWSRRPVYFSSPRNAQIEPATIYDRRYVSRARFTLLPNNRVEIVCWKAGNDGSNRKVTVLGRHLFWCPEIPKRPYLTVQRKNKEVSEFSCLQGHVLQGKPRIHCLVQGVWTDPFPTCVPLTKASSARTAEPEDYNPTNKVNKSTPVVQRSESTPANTMHHVQQGMRTKPVEARDTDFVDKPTVHTSNGKEEPITEGDHGHKREYEPASHPQHSPESTTNKRPVHVNPNENGLNNTQVEAHETSSSRESTTGLVTSVSASTQNVPILHEGHQVQPALDLKSRNESSRSVTCVHPTDSGPCSNHANRSRPTLKSTGDYPVETAAGVGSEVQPTSPERHEEGDYNIYSNNSSMKPPQELKPKAPSSSFDDLPSVTGQPNASSSADVPANPLRPDGPYEPSSTEVHPDLPSAHCTLPERTNRFKAHLKDIPVLPLHSVPHGTELTFHCGPVGEMILKGPDTSGCLNGQWIPQVPHCYGRGSRELDDVFMYFSTEAYTVPGGEVYVEPYGEVLVDCWSTTPIRLSSTTKAQIREAPNDLGVPTDLSAMTANIEHGGPSLLRKGGHKDPVKWSHGPYVLRAQFALEPGQMADIVCSKADNSSRQIRVRGHHLYRCPEIPKTPSLEARRKNRAVYEFSCHTGYRLQGKPTIHCLGQGVWSDPVPTCVPLIETSSTRTTEPEDGNPMNEMDKSTSVVEAQDGCQMKEFFNIASDGLVISSTDTLVPLNSTFWPACDGEEYTLVGNSSAVTCLQNGSWHIPAQMKCIVGCANFDTGPNGPTVVGRRGSYALGDSVTLSCSEGTRLQPRVERITCLGYGWSERAVPVCVPVQEKRKKQRRKKRVQGG